MRRRRSKKKSELLKEAVSRRLHPHRKEEEQQQRQRAAVIIVLSVLGFLLFTGVVFGLIIIFVLRPAYNALLDFVETLGASDYSFMYDDLEEDDEEA